MVNQRERSNGRKMTSQFTVYSDQTNQGKIVVGLKKLVTFIAAVVNPTMEVKSKKERIQIIVKVGAHHLDLSGITWEEVRNNLSCQAIQDQIVNWSIDQIG